MIKEKKYGKNPSVELQRLFKKPYPYQGQAPEKARVIIVGLDATYPEKLDKYPNALALIKEYHENGIGFWQKHKVHHPFLDDNYPKGLSGIGYHKNFRKAIELNHEYKERYAECICFLELLNIPTFGQTDDNEFWNIFRQSHTESHARWLDSVITCRSENRKLILLCEKVMAYMRAIKDCYGIFSWIPKGHVPDDWHDRVGINEVRKRRSFSPQAYHMSTSLKNEYLEKTGRLIIDSCRQGTN